MQSIDKGTKIKMKTAKITQGICLLFCVGIILEITQGEKVYLDECIVDKTQPAKAKNNYVDCTTKNWVEQEKTDCCDLDGDVGCCKAGAKWTAMIMIMVGIGVTTLILAFLCFVFNWVNEDNFPCLNKFRVAVINNCICYHKWIEMRERRKLQIEEEEERKRQAVIAEKQKKEMSKEDTLKMLNSFWNNRDYGGFIPTEEAVKDVESEPTNERKGTAETSLTKMKDDIMDGEDEKKQATVASQQNTPNEIETMD